MSEDERQRIYELMNQFVEVQNRERIDYFLDLFEENEIMPYDLTMLRELCDYFNDEQRAHLLSLNYVHRGGYNYFPGWGRIYDLISGRLRGGVTNLRVLLSEWESVINCAINGLRYDQYRNTLYDFVIDFIRQREIAQDRTGFTFSESNGDTLVNLIENSPDSETMQAGISLAGELYDMLTNEQIYRIFYDINSSEGGD